MQKYTATPQKNPPNTHRSKNTIFCPKKCQNPIHPICKRGQGVGDFDKTTSPAGRFCQNSFGHSSERDLNGDFDKTTKPDGLAGIHITRQQTTQDKQQLTTPNNKIKQQQHTTNTTTHNN